MITLFIVICFAFISLGLPDSLIGTIWPVAQLELGAQLSTAGIVSTVVCIGTVISSLASTKLVNRFKTAKVTVASVLMTAVGIAGYSLSSSVLWIFFFAIPLGLGAGSIDAALNNYVALNFKAKHLSWLHCFWGVGATSGPLIISYFLNKGSSWRFGVGAISIIQFFLLVILVLSLPLWKKQQESINNSSEEHPYISNREAIKIHGLKYALASFFAYCGVELSTGLWATSYLVNTKGVATATAAGWVSLYYAGITIGRFLLGFALDKFTTKAVIRFGTLLCTIGAIIMLLPLPNNFNMIALLLIGIGAGPIFPCNIHETPARFGKEASQAAIGLQMATAYLGNAIIPAAFGFIAQYISISYLPFFLLFFLAIMAISNERINSFVNKKNAHK